MQEPPTTLQQQFSLGAVQTTISPELSFRGWMDELRIWKIARTEEQIQDNLFRRLQDDFDQLIAYYDCDATNPLQDQSGRGLHLSVSNPDQTFVLSTAPISSETAQVRSALAGISTDFHDHMDSSPAVQEYGDMQYDSNGALFGVMKRCYSYIKDGTWHLITGFKVGDLEMEWIGQAQYDPQLIGFIEGTPPCSWREPDRQIAIRPEQLDRSEAGRRCGV
ncbi:MAG: LamG domain-containing protein [Cyanobacteria bacterium CRU_2_1]|nr:LamG domain-containing protein [Cyanobacteria bacterium CRU_2_1]